MSIIRPFFYYYDVILKLGDIMITENTVSKVLPADPHAMHGVDITVPRWDNIKSGGKYQIPYTYNRNCLLYTSDAADE